MFELAQTSIGKERVGQHVVCRIKNDEHGSKCLMNSSHSQWEEVFDPLDVEVSGKCVHVRFSRVRMGSPCEGSRIVSRIMCRMNESPGSAIRS